MDYCLALSRNIIFKRREYGSVIISKKNRAEATVESNSNTTFVFSQT